MASISLIFDLLARDKASKAFNDVGDAADRAGKHGEAFGKAIAGGIKLAAGAFVGAGLIEGFKSFYDAASESAKIGRLTQQVITSTGGAAKLSAGQVGDLVTAISNKTGVDDEAIQSGANLLLTFTNIKNEAGKGNDIFTQTTQIMTDMSAALGTDASGSAIQLGKALNDPVKGVTALQKVGVSFTQSQKDQIATLVKSGDTLGAQKVILAELSKEFGGAAAAASTPLDKLKVNLGNLQEQIGGYLIPIVDRAATFFLAKFLPALASVGTYLQTRLGPVFETVKSAVTVFFSALAGIDATGAAGGFGKVADAGFTVRDALVSVAQVAKQAYAILFKGDFTGGPLDPNSTAVATLGNLRTAFLAVAGFVKDNFFPALSIAKGVLSDLGGVLLPLVKTVTDVGAAILGIVSPAKQAGDQTAFLSDHATAAKVAIEALVGAYLAYKAVQLGSFIVTEVQQFIQLAGAVGLSSAVIYSSIGARAAATIATVASTVAAGASAVASGIATVATAAWTAATVALDVALAVLTSPITLVVVAIAALVAGLIYAYKNSDTFRAIVQTAFKAVGDAADFMWNGVLKPIFAFVIKTWLDVAGGIVSAAATAFGWVPGIGGQLKEAAAKFNTFKDEVNGALDGVNDKTVTVTAAFRTNTMAQENAAGFTGTVKRATGGPVFGPGTGTSDSIPAWLSNGEYVVNARATSRYRGLLERINGYATGGFVTKVPDLGGDPGMAVTGDQHKSQGLRVQVQVDPKPLISAATGFLASTSAAFISAAQAKANQEAASSSAGGGSMVDFLLHHLGVPYSWGGGGISGPSRGFAQGANTIGWDCSSFMQYGAWQALHKLIPRTAAAQQAGLPSQPGPTPGSLVFYGRPAHHVALVTGDGRMIEEPHTGDFSKITSFRSGTSYGHISMYSGGVIQEPISGVGQMTGRSYSFGERGPETVSPGLPHGSSPQVNITYADGMGWLARFVSVQVDGVLAAGASESDRGVLV